MFVGKVRWKLMIVNFISVSSLVDLTLSDSSPLSLPTGSLSL